MPMFDQLVYPLLSVSTVYLVDAAAVKGARFL